MLGCLGGKVENSRRRVFLQRESSKTSFVALNPRALEVVLGFQGSCVC